MNTNLEKKRRVIHQAALNSTVFYHFYIIFEERHFAVCRGARKFYWRLCKNWNYFGFKHQLFEFQRSPVRPPVDLNTLLTESIGLNETKEDIWTKRFRQHLHKIERFDLEAMLGKLLAGCLLAKLLLSIRLVKGKLLPYLSSGLSYFSFSFLHLSQKYLFADTKRNGRPTTF